MPRDWHFYPTGIVYKFDAQKLPHVGKRKIEAQNVPRPQKSARIETSKKQ